ncbi:SCO6745 family protein [Gordonia sp. MP11Mi]|uniref:SalK n=1 Tax=Gordonia sp. MP11Mi TaxID=3022769 RepID=A0AA97CWC8_9ACTN
MSLDPTAAVARRAYESLEPLHVIAYFNPGVGRAQDALGLDGYAFYVGGRGAPLAGAPASLVAATFYNFSPTLIASAWDAAHARGLDAVDASRYEMLDEQFLAILGADCAQLAPLVPEFQAVVDVLPFSGRPLAAAWASTPVPDEPHLALWRTWTIVREWRGDNHIAELVSHGLDGIDAGVFHESELPDPTTRRRVLGRKLFQLTRGWSDDEWSEAVERLAVRGLIEPSGDTPRLTDAGFALYQEIEARTDAVSGTAFPDGLADLVDRTRPFVKKIIDAGILPGTKKS